MPFALCNGPGTFEQLMEQVLAGLPLSTALVYLDDILVPGQSFSHELTNLQKVFERLRICKAEALAQEVSSLKWSISVMWSVRMVYLQIQTK